MKKVIFVFFCMFISLLSYSQDPESNLAKYWSYRKRLEDKFMVVSPNIFEQGTNIPAVRISPDLNGIAWDDGNGSFNQYISVLATEYRLLKNAGQDYSTTIRNLYYALGSFIRLDVFGESYYRTPNVIKDNDGNGCFIRCDVQNPFRNKYGPYGNKHFTENDFGWDSNPSDMLASLNSLDNVGHFLESFSLVNALVDNEMVDGTLVDFKSMALFEATMIINNMYHPDAPLASNFPLSPDVWYLNDPVTGQHISNALGGGLDGGMQILSFGFVSVARHLHLKNTPDYNADLLSSVLFNTAASNPTPEFNFMGIPIIFDDFKVRELCALGNISVGTRNPYQLLIDKQNEATVLKYEYLPMLWCVLNNDYSNISQNDRQYILDLLNTAPTCGPCYIKGKIDGGDNWSSNSRLVNPRQQKCDDDNGKYEGYYNGLDYMFLYNLFALSFKQTTDFTPKLPLSSNPNQSLTLASIITSEYPFGSDLKNLDFKASEQIRLQPGFSFSAGTGNNFSAKIETVLPLYAVDNSMYLGCEYQNLMTKSLKNDNNETSGIQNSSSTNNLKIYPNPASTEITLEYSFDDNSIASISIIDMLGSKVLEQQIVGDNNKMNLDISNLANGIYVYSVIKDGEVIDKKKLVISR